MTIKVLSVVGWCRNGSTIIGNALGEIDGFTHVGELHFLWKNGVGQGVNCQCGCGQTLGECPIWGPILAASPPLDEVVRTQHALARTRHTWRILRRGGDERLRAHAEMLGRTYRAIAERTGATVIIDTSKMTAEAALLPHIDGIEPHFVHLVRDPRAAAHSWRAPKEYVYAMSATRSTLYWDGFNLAARALRRAYPDRSLFLRYEDFTAHPAAAIDRVLALIGADPRLNPIVGRTVELHTNHTVTGNPDRFRVGPTVIRGRDDGWRAGLPVRTRLAATLWAGPLLWAYGYGRRRRDIGIANVTAEEGTVGSGA